VIGAWYLVLARTPKNDMVTSIEQADRPDEDYLILLNDIVLQICHIETQSAAG
jgi:hypothetical protein